MKPGVNKADDYLLLVIKGQTPPQIAESLGVKVATVHSQLSALRRQGCGIPKFKPGRAQGTGGFARLHVARDTRNALRARADARGCDLHELADAMLAKLARSDRLIDAVMGPSTGEKI